jgi:hypothetical protein
MAKLTDSKEKRAIVNRLVKSGVMTLDEAFTLLETDAHEQSAPPYLPRDPFYDPWKPIYAPPVLHQPTT